MFYVSMPILCMFYFSFYVFLLDNLKGRQLLHTTYKMFMTAAGVEGEKGRPITHAAHIMLALHSVSNLYLQIIVYLFHQICHFIFSLIFTQPFFLLDCLLVMCFQLCVYSRCPSVTTALICHAVFFLPSSQFALLLYLLGPVCQRWSGKWVSKDTW